MLVKIIIKHITVTAYAACESLETVNSLDWKWARNSIPRLTWQNMFRFSPRNQGDYPIPWIPLGLNRHADTRYMLALPCVDHGRRGSGYFLFTTEFLLVIIRLVLLFVNTSPMCIWNAVMHINCYYTAYSITTSRNQINNLLRAWNVQFAMQLVCFSFLFNATELFT